MKFFLKQLFCKHNFDIFIRNVYGDEIYMTGKFKRSWWECSKCGKRHSKDHLFNN